MVRKMSDSGVPTFFEIFCKSDQINPAFKLGFSFLSLSQLAHLAFCNPLLSNIDDVLFWCRLVQKSFLHWMYWTWAHLMVLNTVFRVSQIIFLLEFLNVFFISIRPVLWSPSWVCPRSSVVFNLLSLGSHILTIKDVFLMSLCRWMTFSCSPFKSSFPWVVNSPWLSVL